MVVSYALIAAGLTLLGYGGWSYYQHWLEASQPPPARIVEVSLADLETSTPQPTEPQTTATSPPTVGEMQVDASMCYGCSACEFACPEDVIEMVPR